MKVIYFFFSFLFTTTVFAASNQQYNCYAYAIKISEDRRVYFASGAFDRLSEAKAKLQMICKKALRSGEYEQCTAVKCNILVEEVQTTEGSYANGSTRRRMLRRIEDLQSGSRRYYYEDESHLTSRQRMLRRLEWHQRYSR